MLQDSAEAVHVAARILQKLPSLKQLFSHVQHLFSALIKLMPSHHHEELRKVISIQSCSLLLVQSCCALKTLSGSMYGAFYCVTDPAQDAPVHMVTIRSKHYFYLLSIADCRCSTYEYITLGCVQL